MIRRPPRSTRSEFYSPTIYANDERTSFASSARCGKKYGTTGGYSYTNPRMKATNESYISHQVQASDTLQGIALRYGVTTEQVKRSNKLWTNDSLYLREYLRIPIVSDHVTTPTSEASAIMTESKSTLVVLNPNGSQSSINSNDSERSLQDYLGHIDSKIDHAVNEAKKLQSSSNVANDGVRLNGIGGSLRGHRPKLHAPIRLRHSLSSEYGGEFNALTADLSATKVVGQNGRTSQTSLQRSTQDEMFEL
uniref:EOG090X0DPX n=1 Tax=Lynceus sp. MCZ IZ 141354 TaxID=1930659 RepID=A0A9N6ZG19_9CRUS|nr:EOG090X0DPX [Lynceus sp. MCZ IZ 141354]